MAYSSGMPVSLIGLFLGVAAVSVGAMSAQQAVSLTALTVPRARLPSRCKLNPAVRENPWIGRSDEILASILAMVEGPAGGRDEVSVHPLARSVAHVLEGYRARYVTDGGSTIRVFAVRFDDPIWTAAARRADVNGEPARIVNGSIAVHISRIAPTGLPDEAEFGEACEQSIREHILSLRTRRPAIAAPRREEDADRCQGSSARLRPGRSADWPAFATAMPTVVDGLEVDGADRCSARWRLENPAVHASSDFSPAPVPNRSKHQQASRRECNRH